jgi:hypothetical protein
MSGATTTCGSFVMRHDPASAAVEVMLRSLKMYGMAQAVGELIEQGAPICRSASQAERCCSTCSANSTNAPASSSPPTSASANGPTCSAMPK